MDISVAFFVAVVVACFLVILFVVKPRRPGNRQKQQFCEHIDSFKVSVYRINLNKHLKLRLIQDLVNDSFNSYFFLFTWDLVSPVSKFSSKIFSYLVNISMNDVSWARRCSQGKYFPSCKITHLKTCNFGFLGSE